MGPELNISRKSLGQPSLCQMPPLDWLTGAKGEKVMSYKIVDDSAKAMLGRKRGRGGYLVHSLGVGKGGSRWADQVMGLVCLTLAGERSIAH